LIFVFFFLGDMAEIVKQTQLQKMFVVNLLQHMQFATPLAWKDFEDAIEVINIKTAANQQMARELKKKGKAGGLIGGLVKPFSPGEKASKEGAQYNTYHPSSGALASPRYEDLSSSGSGAVVDEVTTEEETEEEDELYEFG
jgi:Rod binding domain-containing protein